MSFIISNGKFVTIKNGKFATVGAPQPVQEYFWIAPHTAGEIISAYANIMGEGGDPNLSYSTDQQTWTKWENPTVPKTFDSKTYLRINALYPVVPGEFWYTDCWSLVADGDNLWDIGGTLASITNGTLNTVTIRDGEALGLFAQNTNIVDASNLTLFSTTAQDCYNSMFYGCTALTSTPELPATILADRCYWWMFRYCTSLTAAPELPATTLAAECYRAMFQGCTSLTTAPTLSITTLANSCYYDMFYGCTSLITAPALPATTLTYQCYRGMFCGCRSLTSAPTLPATTLTTYCYQAMFYGCQGLTVPPALPATTLAESCYYNMFYGCTSLTSAPALPATTLTYQCYRGMFEGCTNLYIHDAPTAETGKNMWIIPANGTFDTNSTQKDMFYSCPGTRSSVANLVATAGSNTTFYTQNTPIT